MSRGGQWKADRGFRGAVYPSDITLCLPPDIQQGDDPAYDANAARQLRHVTKDRWVVEKTNALVENWKRPFARRPWESAADVLIDVTCAAFLHNRFGKRDKPPPTYLAEEGGAQ